MKYLNFSKQFPLILGAIALFSSCKKVDNFEPIGDAGQTIIKLMGGGEIGAPGEKTTAINFVNTPTTISILDIRRDAPNEADLSNSVTVTLRDDTAAVRAAGYVNLNPAWYSLSGSGVTKTGGVGGVYTATFAPGEFSKQVKIVIPNATLLDPSSLYGLGFTVLTSTFGNISVVAKSFVGVIGAKNDYDGVYECTFNNYHPSSNPGYTGDVTDIHFITTGANKVKIYWPLAGAFACPSILGGGFSYFGAQQPEYTINTATNAVTVQNVDPAATTFYTMNASFNSRYEPATKTFYVKWGYSYTVPGVFDATCREWTQTLKYKGPR